MLTFTKMRLGLFLKRTIYQHVVLQEKTIVRRPPVVVIGASWLRYPSALSFHGAVTNQVNNYPLNALV